MYGLQNNLHQNKIPFAYELLRLYCGITLHPGGAALLKKELASDYLSSSETEGFLGMKLPIFCSVEFWTNQNKLVSECGGCIQKYCLHFCHIRSPPGQDIILSKNTQSLLSLRQRSKFNSHKVQTAFV